METKKKKNKTNISFETALKELEQITEKLEEGNLSLEKSIELFERGIRLSKLCNDMLEEAEGKIEILQKQQNSESPRKINFEFNEEIDEPDE